MTQTHKQLYEFGLFRLDAGERLLLRDGKVVPLTPKAFDLLLALVEQPGRLLEKEVLLKTVWPGSFVEENNLADNISRLRKALGEGEQGQKFIKTIPKRGYRFVAEVRKHNGSRTQPIVEAAATPAGSDETLTVPPAPASRRNPFSTTLRLLVIVAPVLIGTGLWLHFRLERSAEVRQLEFQGDFYIARWTEAEIRKGLEYYNRAVALDPNSASAYSGQATAWIFLTDLYTSPREAMPKAKAAAQNALQRDDSHVGARVSLGVIKMEYEWDWPGAEAEFKRALKRAPDYDPAHQLYGWYLIAVGRLAEAQTEMERVTETDALNDFTLWELGLCFYFQRQYEQAVEQYRRAIGVEPKSYWPHMLLGWAYEQQGKFSDAIAESNKAYLLNDNPQVLAALGHAYAVAGQRAEAQKLIEELQETAKLKYVSPYDLATIYAGLGEKEQALAQLEKAYEDRSGWLALWLKVDPKFDGLRADERFRDLLRRVGHTP